MINLIAPITDTITSLYTSYNDRKKAKESASAKLAYMRETGDQQVQFTDQEWEAISKRSESSTWKDEYVTLIISFPLIVLYSCVFLTVFTGNEIYALAAQQANDELIKILPNYQEILAAVVLAAIGIKALTKK
jgi:hypothetical protein